MNRIDLLTVKALSEPDLGVGMLRRALRSRAANYDLLLDLAEAVRLLVGDKVIFEMFDTSDHLQLRAEMLQRDDQKRQAAIQSKSK